MTQEDKQLLLVDLCARLPYGVKAQVWGWDEEKGEVEVPLKVYSINTDGYLSFEYNHYSVETVYVEDCRLYLRPMSSMTRKELHECQEILGMGVEIQDGFIRIIDSSIKRFTYLEIDAVFAFLNKKMFDIRGLIPKGLALEAPEGMYNI